MLVAERIREAVLNENIEHARSSAGNRVSVSIGVAHLFAIPANAAPAPGEH